MIAHGNGYKVISELKSDFRLDPVALSLPILGLIPGLIPSYSLATACTWIVMKEDVDEILIAPCNPEPVFLVILDHVAGPINGSHHRQVHQHHPGVQP